MLFNRELGLLALNLFPQIKKYILSGKDQKNETKNDLKHVNLNTIQNLWL